jgi:hypothetical protein
MMAKEKNEPVLKEKTTSSEIGLYVRFWLKEYIDNPENRSKVLEKLKVVFSSNSPYRAQILTVNKFGTVFRNKIGQRRMPILKEFLMQIDPERFGKVQYKYK